MSLSSAAGHWNAKKERRGRVDGLAMGPACAEDRLSDWSW